MAPNTFPPKAEAAVVTTRCDLLSLFHDDNLETQSVYHIATPGV